MSNDREEDVLDVIRERFPGYSEAELRETQQRLATKVHRGTWPGAVPPAFQGCRPVVK